MRIKEEKIYSLNVETGFEKINQEIERYLIKTLNLKEFKTKEESNVNINIRKSNNLIFKNPYESIITSQKNGNITQVDIEGVEIEGIFAK